MACHHGDAVSRVPPFLELPAEIRNEIYAHLCHSAAPICLYFYQNPGSNIPQPVVPFAPHTTIPVAFFLTCRQLNAEASSVFYSENVFLLNRRTKFASLMKPCFISALLKFFAAVGSRAMLVRNIVFNTFTLYNSVFLRTYTGNTTRYLESATDMLEVIVLLRQAWNRGLNFRIQLVDVADVEEDRAAYWIHNPDLIRATRVMAIINSLLGGQLSLKQYQDYVHAIAIKRDGSGGLIGWTSNIHCTYPISPSRSHGRTTIEFRAKDGGKQLELIPYIQP